ncbi:signal transduction histidine kinase [Microbacterium laevaniformans]|uniref:sensor histidine kinase n=1 Tax=Microbacterium laevaniformans TaxID=36807 RepID=UPI0019579DD8|nr:sensor histidine kinase [Microbacterium laevaniformans]MBM7754086.1 signal transduction histidine kinase [Microbacterium laevaniformans]
MSDLQSTGHRDIAELHFEVHPSVLFKLGEDLITDDAQALVELIKNSYDADAQTVRVEIDTEHWYDRVSGEQLETDMASPAGAVRGRLTVQDDGHGMSLDAIKRGWLTVSNSEKRVFKSKGLTTARDRTPLGDKGLGRLGVQRLGHLVGLTTVAAEPGGQARHELMIDWASFFDAENLSSVLLAVSSEPALGARTGSTVSVLGLKNRGYWEGTGELDLQKQLVSILSPYENAAGLRVFIKINGAEVDMRREARRLLDAAPNILQFSFRDGILEIGAKTQVSALRGQSAVQSATFQQLISPDNGHAFAEWLLSEHASRAKAVGAELGDDKYFLRFQRKLAFDDAVDPRFNAGDPGPFSGELSSFTYGRAEDSALDSASELRDFARSVAGIRVFRDGFGIRLDDDWLGLSAQQTTATSFYGLRPLNTAGFVNLSARDNAALEETSSREAFRDTPAWRGFFQLMIQVVKFARETQELVRRNWTIYAREHTTPSELSDTATPSDIGGHIVARASEALKSRSRAQSARRTLNSLDRIVEDLSTSAQDSALSMWTDPKLREAVDKAASQISDAQSQLVSALGEVDSILGVLDDLRGAAALLEEKLTLAEERISNAWESVALGLSAEILAHEVDQISDRLRGRSHQILDYLRKQQPIDTRTVAYVEHVRASSAELTRQVARLNPALRFRRETRSTHLVSELILSAAEFHGPRLKAARINLAMETVQDFRIRVNEGKFMQVIDNLIRNSEYWVTRHLLQKHIETGEITVTIDSPRVIVSDNGPGVQPSVEDTLFEPFITMKPMTEGRGLGLFVVSQLLDSEGGSIALGEHRNKGGRPDTFEVDLRGLLEGDANPAGSAE